MRFAHVVGPAGHDFGLHRPIVGAHIERGNRTRHDLDEFRLEQGMTRFYIG
jgi:hypothetical protein